MKCFFRKIRTFVLKHLQRNCLAMKEKKGIDLEGNCSSVNRSDLLLIFDAHYQLFRGTLWTLDYVDRNFESCVQRENLRETPSIRSLMHAPNLVAIKVAAHWLGCNFLRVRGRNGKFLPGFRSLGQSFVPSSINH